MTSDVWKESNVARQQVSRKRSRKCLLASLQRQDNPGERELGLYMPVLRGKIAPDPRNVHGTAVAYAVARLLHNLHSALFLCGRPGGSRDGFAQQLAPTQQFPGNPPRAVPTVASNVNYRAKPQTTGKQGSCQSGPVADENLWSVITCATFAHKCPNSGDVSGESQGGQFVCVVGSPVPRGTCKV